MPKKQKPTEISLRWIMRDVYAYSQNSVMILQQQVNGKWVDVPIEKEPLPDGRSK